MVVGDIILIETGMRVPADCVLIDGMDITVDEAPYFEDRETINAKSLSVGTLQENNHVSNPDPFLLADSLVMSGSGKAVVCAVGGYKYLNEIGGGCNLVGIGSDDEENLTPLQQRLKRIANQLSKFGYTVGIVLFITMTAYLGLKVLITPQQLLENATLLQLINIFSICCAVIIVAVPEGLPLSISIAMAFSINIFKKDKLLLKKLAACEQMGQVTEICTGKTATLTKNDMTVSMFYLAEQIIKNVEKDTLTTSQLNQTVVDTLRDCIIYNCDSRIEMSDDAMYEPQGNGTEIGLLRLLTDNEMAVSDLYMNRQRYCITETNIPFGPIRKRQVVAIRPTHDADFVRVVVKGAPEYVMPMCVKQLNQNGDVDSLSEIERDRILQEVIIGTMARKQGLRTLAFAYRDYDLDEWNNLKEEHN